MATFNPSSLINILQQSLPARRYLVGFSGGLDSTALLHALHALREKLSADIEAIHFNHGVNSQADEWQGHCESFCARLGLPLKVESLVMNPDETANFEERAREHRYKKIAQILHETDIFLTAHHRDDQAETLLLNLMRGAGLQGMAGIPRLRRLGSGWVMRPLLEYSRANLQSYVEQQELTWCRDPSNQNPAFDRNFLRGEIMPLLERRWPGAAQRLARSTTHARQSADLLGQFIDKQYAIHLDNPVTLPLRVLDNPSDPFAPVLLRHWLRKHETPHLPAARLSELLRQLSGTAGAEVRWAGWMLRRYGEHLWLQEDSEIDSCPHAAWQGCRLSLGAPWGDLEVSAKAQLPTATLTVRCRRQGDRLRLASGAPSRSFKQLFQQAQVPPWLRNAVPILCLDGKPAAIGNWMFDATMVSWLKNAQASLRWHPVHPALKRVQELAQETVVDPAYRVG